MKRYQCIKEWWTFSKGLISDAIDGPPSHEGGADLIGPHGRIYEVTKSQLSDHFQELLDLHVDDFPDQETMDAEADRSMRGLSIGCAIAFAVFITLALIVWWALTWRS